jgi:BON domain
MSPIRYRDDESSSSRGFLFLAAGAAAGIALGVFLAQRAGGFSALSSRVRERFGGEALRGRGRAEAAHGVAEDDEEDDFEADEAEELEERVLEAFRNDPILAERAVDIGAVGDGIIELSGWVHDESEADHALTLTRGVPDVTTVVNRLAIRTEEQQRARNARRYAGGDPALTEARWEGQGVGTGRRRQGTSAEVDRHADPKPNLEDRWMKEQHAIEAAAEDMDGIAERRNRQKAPREGDRTGGAPVAPTGVPKGDHVAEPESREAQEVLKEQTGRDTSKSKTRAD